MIEPLALLLFSGLGAGDNKGGDPVKEYSFGIRLGKMVPP
jgi:hypothetical protein